ncbi:MAG: nuclear transport factor 2 family protein [Planctomycetes bacterium]|nr:nuclear transport factor 2 family protein [Planctomycetota bacterium]
MATVHLLALCLAALPLGCASAPAPVSTTEVQALLDAQRAAWDQGDLEAFMAGYWRSPQLGFVGSTGLTTGFDETLARYRAAYPDAAARGTLTFELVRVTPLAGGRAAVAVGRWHLARAEPASGWFSIVLERRPEGLRIVHDHSS